MGEMTIRLDDALLVRLQGKATSRSVALETLVAELLQAGMHANRATRWPVARAIRASGAPRSPISSVELLDQIRDEGR